MDHGSTSESVRAVVEWLVDGARTAGQPQDVLAELCERLLACGLPLHRVAVFVTTLHPDVMGQRFLWRRGQGVVVTEADYGMPETDTYRRSPVPIVFRTAAPIRRRIEDPGCPNDYGIVEELRAEGVTDYLIQPLPFTNGEVHAVSWTTTQEGGFADDHIAALEAIRRPFAAWPRCTRCAGSRPRCLAPTSAAAPASASCRAGSDAATSSASMP